MERQFNNYSGSQGAVSFILVTYNRLESLMQVLKAIETYQWVFTHFVIIDNCSTDGTGEWLTQINKNNKYKILTAEKNIGHGAALAKGFDWLQKNSNAAWYITLEDDSVPDAQLPYKLLRAIEHSSFDFISPAGYFATTGKRVFVINDTDTPVEAQFGIFDGSVLRSSVLSKTGLPKQNWFMMFDDYEFCYRMLKHGCKIGVIRNDFHTILHHGGGEKFSKASIWRGYYHARNHTLFLKNYFSLQVLLDYIIIQLKTIAGLMAAPDRFKRISLRLKGMLHGLMGKDGFTLDPQTLQFVK